MLQGYDFSPYFTSAEQLSIKLLEAFFNGTSAVYPINPFQIMKEMDIPFVFRDFKMYEGVYLAPDGEDDIPIVAINSNRPLTRQRFTAAHELCHHLKDRNVKLLCPIEGQKSAIEIFADRFASALLMPEQELRIEVAKYENNGFIEFDDVLKVADYFAVSFEACVFRIAYKLHKISGATDPGTIKKRIRKYRPKEKRTLLGLGNYDIDLFKAILDHAISNFILNSSQAVWYKFKNEFVYNENRLEGLDVDLQTVSEIITDLRLHKQDSEFCKESYNVIVEVAGHAAMYDFIIGNQDRKLSAFTLLKLNKILYQYAPYPDVGGGVRTTDTLVRGAKFETLHYQDIPNALLELDKVIKPVMAEMDNMSMCDFIDEVLKIHHQITVIHPFADGNGRTSRVFLNWMFLLKGIPPVYFKAEKKDEYIEALHIADVSDDFTKLREVFYKAVISSYLELSDFSINFQ